MSNSSLGSTVRCFNVVVTVACSLILSACQKKPEQTSPPLATPAYSQPQAHSGQGAATLPLSLIAEDVVSVRLGVLTQATPFSGTVQAASQSSVQTQTTGTVRRVSADVGQMVRKGQVLVELSSPDDQARLAQARANLASTQAQARLAQSLVERKKRLYNQGYIARLEYEQAQVEASAQAEAVRAQQANVTIAQKAAQDSRVISPLSGVVSQRNVEVGQTINAGQTVFEIVDNRQVEIKATAPMSTQAQATVGQMVQFTVQGNTTPLNARITRIAPLADSASRTVVFYATPINTQTTLPIGAFVEGNLLQSNNVQGQIIPLGSIQQRDRDPYVWVVREQRLRKVAIQVRQIDVQNDLALVSGLNNTDQVSLVQFTEQENGRQVTVQSQSSSMR